MEINRETHFKSFWGRGYWICYTMFKILWRKHSFCPKLGRITDWHIWSKSEQHHTEFDSICFLDYCLWPVATRGNITLCFEAHVVCSLLVTAIKQELFFCLRHYYPPFYSTNIRDTWSTTYLYKHWEVNRAEKTYFIKKIPEVHAGLSTHFGNLIHSALLFHLIVCIC